MKFNFTGHGVKGGGKILQRFLEILPGLTSWTIILGMFILSLIEPVVAAVMIIAFLIYWFLKLLYLTIFLIISYFRLSIEKDTDWMKRARGANAPEAFIKDLKNTSNGAPFRKRLSDYFCRRRLEFLMKKRIAPPPLDDLYHLVIIPVAKETSDIVEPGLRSIAGSTFPPGKILVILALEERANDDVKKGVLDMRSKYKKTFLDLMVNVHKDGVRGEARVKGANTSAAAKTAAKYFKERSVPFENVIVSCFDSDTVVNPQYFACLAYSFMTSAERTRSSFQPIPVYYNNIWDVPGFARVLETGSSFFQLIEATNPEQLVTFSSHSMSFSALVDVGYWPVDMISDDSAIFWKSYVCFDGNYRVVPMYTTVSMDIVAANIWWKTIINEYKQKRRWAWGVENFPIVVRAFLKDRKMSLFNKMRLVFKMLEGHISWATWAFLLTVIVWIPSLFGGRHFQETVLYYSAPRINAVIFNLASFSLITSIILSMCLLPRQKMRHPFLKRIVFALQWLLIPLIILFLSAIPALDAQTRLMLGKRLEFWVAPKKRD